MKKAYRLLIPGIILQSVLIGGGFATGREIVEYGAKYGPQGLLSGIIIFLGFSLISILTFEISRKYQVYDYKSLLKVVIGPFWIVFELVFILGSILIIAVMASAAGEILKDIFSLNYWIGVTLVILVVGFINLKGENFLVKMKTIGTIGLFLSFTLFGILLLYQNFDSVIRVFNSKESSFSSSEIAFKGIQYVGYNLGVYPAVIFTVKNLHTKKESIASGVISGILMTVPWFLTFIALMGFYPSESVFNAPVPWLEMLKTFSALIISIYGVVVGWTLIETATGLIHAMLDRIDIDMIEGGKKILTLSQKGIISVAILGFAVLLAQFGIIDLIGKGYAYLSYGIIAVFAIPVIIKGVPILLRKDGK